MSVRLQYVRVTDVESISFGEPISRAAPDLMRYFIRNL